ncbi:MAG: FAD-dependent oxidoreductase [Methanobacteriota archaeon]|nr:MAG: FAD-dependent oxidoreductase [Euryarchaeota archaeon]
MPSPYDVIVVGSGPAGATAARYAARRGLRVLLVDKRKEIGVPVQCGEYVAHNEEVRAIFPTVTELEDLMEVPYRVREIDTPVIRIWSPNGRRYDIPFQGFTVQRDKMDQGITAQAIQEGADVPGQGRRRLRRPANDRRKVGRARVARFGARDERDRGGRLQRRNGHVLRQSRAGRIRVDHPEGGMRERRPRDLGALPREPARALQQVRRGSRPRARKGDGRLRPGPRAAASDSEG